MNGNKFATGEILEKPVEVVKGRILAGWARKSPEPCTWVHSWKGKCISQDSSSTSEQPHLMQKQVAAAVLPVHTTLQTRTPPRQSRTLARGGPTYHGHDKFASTGGSRKLRIAVTYDSPLDLSSSIYYSFSGLRPKNIYLKWLQGVGNCGLGGTWQLLIGWKHLNSGHASHQN